MLSVKPGTVNGFRFWYLLFSALVIIPVWSFKNLAMVDAPQHLSQLADIESLLYGSHFISSEVYLNLFTPYLTTNLILTLLTLISSPAVALKAATSFYLLVLPWCCLRLLRLYKKPEFLSLLCFPLLYNLPFNWGFIPFMVTAALGCLWLVSLLERDISHFSLPHIAISYALAFGHAMAWGLNIAYILTWLIFNRKISRHNAGSLFLLLSPAVWLLCWSFYVSGNEASANLVGLIYQSPFEKTAILITGHLMGNDLLFGGIKLLLYGYLSVRLLGITRSLTPSHQLIIATLALFYLLPSLLLSTSFFSDRLAILLPVFLPLLFDSIKKKTAYTLLATLCLLLAVTSRLNQQWILEKERQDFESVTHSIPANTRVFYISDPDDFGYYQFGLMLVPYYLHYGHWLRAEKEVLIDFSFAYYFNQPVRHINKRNITSRTNKQYPAMDWSLINGHDFILIRDCSLVKPKTITAEAGYLFTGQQNCWALFRRNSVDEREL